MLGVVLALTACASVPPPTSELAAAQQAVSRANDADAEQYAVHDLAQARQALRLAQSAMASGRNADALMLARQASANADLATAHSKEAVANTELAQRRAEVADLRQRLGMEGGQ